MENQQEIIWTTPKGNDVRVSILTSTPNIADHNFSSPCYDLIVYVNDDNFFLSSGFDVIDHPTAGPVIKGWFSNHLILVPADIVEELKALISSYEAEVGRRFDETMKAEADYQSRYQDVNRMMMEGRA